MQNAELTPQERAARADEEQALKEAQAARWQGVTLRQRELADRAIKRKVSAYERLGVTVIPTERSHTTPRQDAKIVTFRAARGLAKMLHMNKTVDRINNTKI